MRIAVLAGCLGLWAGAASAVCAAGGAPAEATSDSGQTREATEADNDLASWLVGEFDARGGESLVDHLTVAPVQVVGVAEPALLMEMCYRGMGPEVIGQKAAEKSSFYPARGADGDVREVRRRELEAMDFVASALYTVRTDPGADLVVLEQWLPRTSLVSLTGKPGERHAIQPVEQSWIERVPACDLKLRRVGSVFESEPSPAACLSPGTTRVGAPRVTWQITADGVRIQPAGRGDGPAPDAPALTSNLSRCRYFDVQRFYLEDLELGHYNPVDQRLHDQLGLARFPAPSGGGRRRLVAGADGVNLELERVADRRELRATRWWDDGRSEPLLQIAVPLTVDGMAFEIDNVRFELRAVEHGSSTLDELASWLAGSFSNLAQVAAEHAWPVGLHVAPIWAGRDTGHWFYLELAHAATPEQPFRQRVHHLRWVRPWLIEMESFRLKDPGPLAGAWQDPARLAALSREDLEAAPGCEVLFRPRGTSWVGSTFGTVCASDVDQARYETLMIRLTSDELVLDGRVFGDDGFREMTWAPFSNRYLFRRVSTAEAGD